MVSALGASNSSPGDLGQRQQLRGCGGVGSGLQGALLAFVAGLPGMEPQSVDARSAAQVRGDLADGPKGTRPGLTRAAQGTAPRPTWLDPYKPLIEETLRRDLDAPPKQRHTAKRVFGWLPEPVRQPAKRPRSRPVPRAWIPSHAR